MHIVIQIKSKQVELSTFIENISHDNMILISLIELSFQEHLLIEINEFRHVEISSNNNKQKKKNC